MFCFFFFNDTATTEIYTLSLHDALPISARTAGSSSARSRACGSVMRSSREPATSSSYRADPRSEEHTSELQSRRDLVCRLLLEKKKKPKPTTNQLKNIELNNTPTIATFT